ncbi:hypothetical protein D5086_024662 [Populus alba]|uniref:Uncharacterized protein n=1 Tax=Populus alba TaxID=43335 RepID=A0ACC4B643_POPAL
MQTLLVLDRRLPYAATSPMLASCFVFCLLGERYSQLVRTSTIPEHVTSECCHVRVPENEQSNVVNHSLQQWQPQNETEKASTSKQCCSCWPSQLNSDFDWNLL